MIGVTHEYILLISSYLTVLLLKYHSFNSIFHSRYHGPINSILEGQKLLS